MVTGAASGIGRALADVAGSLKMRLVLVDVDQDGLDRAASDLRRSGLTVQALRLDVSEQASVDALAEAALALGPVQLVCSNAGVLIAGRTWELTDDQWARSLEVNLWATIRLIRAFVPHLIETGRPAHLLITGSMASVTTRPAIAPYSTCKHALLALAETTWMELHEIDAPVGVTLLMPGQVATGMVPGRAGENGLFDPAAVAEAAFAAMRADRLFAFTHPDRMQDVRDRMDRILTGDPTHQG